MEESAFYKLEGRAKHFFRCVATLLFMHHSSDSKKWTLRKRVLIILSCMVFAIAGLWGMYDLYHRLLYESQGPITWDTTVYLGVGRGILNGLIPYRDLFDIKPPGIYLLSAASLWLTGGAAFGSIMEVIAIAGTCVSLVILRLMWMSHRDIRNCYVLFTLCLSLLFGIAIALYAAERSGEFQVESFGAFFLIVYLIVIADLKNANKWTWIRIAFASLFLLFSIGMKEPFLFVSMGCALLLCADKPHSFLHAYVLPLAIAAGTGIFIMVILQYALPYSSIYLPEMIGKHINTFGSPWLRAFHLERIFWDLWAYEPALSLTITFLSLSYLLGVLPHGNRWLFVRRSCAALCALYLFGLSVGLGGEYYNHHFVFAVPGFITFFIIFLQDIQRTPKKRLQYILGGVMAFFLFAVTFTERKIDYIGRLQFIRADSTPAREAADQIDAILDACHLSRYLFLGSNGQQPYAYTVHSPLGPLFLQFDKLLDSDHPQFRQAFLQSVTQAELVVLRDYHINDLRSTVEQELQRNFSKVPWPCVPELSETGYVFFFRSQNKPI